LSAGAYTTARATEALIHKAITVGVDEVTGGVFITHSGRGRFTAHSTHHTGAERLAEALTTAFGHITLINEAVAVVINPITELISATCCGRITTLLAHRADACARACTLSTRLRDKIFVDLGVAVVVDPIAHVEGDARVDVGVGVIAVKSKTVAPSPIAVTILVITENR
jgi:hypothetical protein